MPDTKITGLTAVVTPVDADVLPVVQDTAGTPTTKKITWTVIKAFLKTYFDGLYYIVGGADVAIADGGTGASTAAAAFAALKQAATTSASGVLEIALSSEINTGTDNTRAITPDGLAGSNYGVRVLQVELVEGATAVATGDKQGNYSFRVPSEMNGWNLVGIAAHIETAGVTGNLDIQIRNATQTADMLSTLMRIETTETDTSTSAQPGVIDTAEDDVATGDKIMFDVDSVQSGTAPLGLTVTLKFQLP